LYGLENKILTQPDLVQIRILCWTHSCFWFNHCYWVDYYSNKSYY
jgi:G:T-mismatch repair DNA endonuclease (very short patch repair protein)